MRKTVAILVALLLSVTPPVEGAQASVASSHLQLHLPAQAAGAAPRATDALFLRSGVSIWGVCGLGAALIPAVAASCVGTSVIAPAVDSALQNSIIKPMADEMGELTGNILRTGLGWWLTTSSIQVANTGIDKPNTVTIKGTNGNTVPSMTVSVSLQGICLLIGEVIALLLMFIAAIRTMIQRKGVHLGMAAQGLIINALVCAMGITVIDSLLVASDALTRSILQIGFSGNADAVDHIVQVMVSTAWNPMMLLTLASVGFLVGLAQLIMAFLRQAAIPIQALILPIAGAGQIGGERTRQWLPRLYTSIFTVIAYKPTAALILSVGFVELQNGSQLLDWIRGIVTLVLSTFALRALMALFAPLGTSLAGATAGGGFMPALLQVAGSLGMSHSVGRGATGGGTTSAVAHAQQMARTGPAAAHPAAAAAITAGQLAQARVGSGAVAMSGQDARGGSPAPDGQRPDSGQPGPAVRPDGNPPSPPPPPPPLAPGGPAPDGQQPPAPRSSPAPTPPARAGRGQPAPEAGSPGPRTVSTAAARTKVQGPPAAGRPSPEPARPPAVAPPLSTGALRLGSVPGPGATRLQLDPHHDDVAAPQPSPGTVTWTRSPKPGPPPVRPEDSTEGQT